MRKYQKDQEYKNPKKLGPISLTNKINILTVLHEICDYTQVLKPQKQIQQLASSRSNNINNSA